jgi:predicted ATP-dependent endonuclease of OLD family
MFFAKKVLICEGASEKIFFDYLLDNEWSDIEKDGLYILDSLGKYNIHRFMNLFEKLGIIHFVMFDYDKDKPEQKKLNDFIHEAQNSFTKKIDHFEKDIENFLEITSPSRSSLKPLNMLYKYKTGEIDQAKIGELKKKIQALITRP